MSEINRIKISRDFYLSEYHCKGKNCCGHLVKLDPELIFLVQKLRDTIRCALTVNSAYRCRIHNKEEGGKEHSYHLEGMAADITCGKINAPDLAKFAKHIGFKTILVYKKHNFIHVDVREKPLGLVEP